MANIELKEILLANKNLEQRFKAENWQASYNKRTDMIIMGSEFPAETFYFPIEDTGLMLRIDSGGKIYGFAIENAKYFIKKNPEIGISLSFLVHPFTSQIVSLVSAFALKIGSIGKVNQIEAVTGYVTRRAAFA